MQSEITPEYLVLDLGVRPRLVRLNMHQLQTLHDFVISEGTDDERFRDKIVGL